ncbi:type I-B CRISPR-associated protein Cas7/Cst2/DevR [Thermovibrio sp.]
MEKRLRALTLTVVFKGLSANYGESVGNVSELKKLTHGGELYSYVSRQALRYELWKFLKENHRIDTPEYWESEPGIKEEVEKLLSSLGMESSLPPPQILTSEQDVVQFHPSVNALNCVEADLFGYMKTEGGRGADTRSAVVRFSPAIALEPLSIDLEFGTNKNFADRAGTTPDPFQFEHHYSLYTYTVTVDLDKLGVELNRKGEVVGELPKEERIRRLKMVIESIPFLSREIKGRIENLSPLFAVGGFYPVKNPFFLGRVEVGYDRKLKKFALNPEPVLDTLGLSFKGSKVKDGTKVALLKGFWANEEELKEEFLRTNVPVLTVSELFNQLLEEADKVYGD